MARPSETDYPVSLTLRFKSDKAKAFFIAQMTDGLLENEVDVETWRVGDRFDDADTLAVAVFDTRDWRASLKREPDEVI